MTSFARIRHILSQNLFASHSIMSGQTFLREYSVPQIRLRSQSRVQSAFFRSIYRLGQGVEGSTTGGSFYDPFLPAAALSMASLGHLWLSLSASV